MRFYDFQQYIGTYIETQHLISRATLIWLSGITLLVCIGLTAFVNDNAVPYGIVEYQWIWLYKFLAISLLAWIICYILKSHLSMHILSTGTEYVLMIASVSQSLYGALQIAGICCSGNSNFILSGSFNNPGPYSGYLAAIFPIALYILLKSNGGTNITSKVQKIISACTIVLTCCVLPVGMSRAAWLSILISSGYIILHFYKFHIWGYIHKHKYYITPAILVIIVCTAGLYLLKQDSADGRILIWKITSRAIIANPYGEKHGRTFSAFYGDAQEQYFSTTDYSQSEAIIAGTPDYAFNEYLQIAAEHGVCVALILIIVLCLIIYAVRNNDKLIGFGGSLISVAVFSCFSYPLHIPAILSICILDIWIIIGHLSLELRKLRIGKCILGVMATSCALFCLNLYNDFTKRYSALSEWMQVRALYYTQAYQATCNAYDMLYDRMSWNKEFCFEYGRSLYKANRNNDAESILLKGLTISGDPMFLNILGQNAQRRGNYKAAEKYLLRSTRRLPARIYPYVLLVKLYSIPEYYDKHKLYKAAYHVLNDKPKVYSKAVLELRREVIEIIKDNGIEL